MAVPVDLTVFLRALDLALEMVAIHLRVEEVALVELAWTIPDTVLSSHGWVVALKDGRRFYLAYSFNDTRPIDEAEELELIALRSDQAIPRLANDPRVLWYRPDALNRLLDLALPPLN